MTTPIHQIISYISLVTSSICLGAFLLALECNVKIPQKYIRIAGASLLISIINFLWLIIELISKYL